MNFKTGTTRNFPKNQEYERRAAADDKPGCTKPDASVKFSVVREENPKEAWETLTLPYAFPSESMGTTIGVGGMAKGYSQDQILLVGTVFSSFDDSLGFVAGM